MKSSFLFVLVIFMSVRITAQNSVGIGTTTPNSTAALDVNSTSKGLLIPRMSSAQRKAIAAPAPGLLVFDSDKQGLYMYNGDQWIQFAITDHNTTIPSSHTISGSQMAYMGEDVAVDVDWAVVGAPQLEVNDSAANGAVYVMRRVAGGWQIVQQLLPNTFDRAANFGHAVAISGDLIAVGAYAFDESQAGNGDDEGAVFIYKRNVSTNQWNFLQKVISSSTSDGDWFGWSVDITAANLVIGAPRDGIGPNDDDDGAFYIYEWNGSSFGTELKLRLPNNPHHDDWFGNAVTVDGSYAAVAAWRRDINTSADRGVVYIYVKGGGTWTFQDSVLASSSDEFGKSLEMDGSYLVVGAGNFTNETWGVYLFSRSGSQWNQLSSEQSDVSLFDDGSNTSIEVSISYPWVVVAAANESLPAPYKGVVYVFEIVNNILTQRKKIYDVTEYMSDPSFGKNVSTNGTFIFIGSSISNPVSGGGYQGKVSIATIGD